MLPPCLEYADFAYSLYPKETPPNRKIVHMAGVEPAYRDTSSHAESNGFSSSYPANDGITIMLHMQIRKIVHTVSCIHYFINYFVVCQSPTAVALWAWFVGVCFSCLVQLVQALLPFLVSVTSAVTSSVAINTIFAGW